MNDGHRPDEEEVLRAIVTAQFYIILVVRNQFSFLCCAFPDYLSSHVGPNDEGLPHVPDAKQQTQAAVPHADTYIAGKHNGVGALLGTGQLSEHNAHHEGLQYDARDALNAHHQHCLGAFLRDVSGSISNGMLRLNREEKACRESLDLFNASLCPVDVAVDLDDHVPDEGKSKPANNEGKEEDQEGPAPLHVDECGIQVLEVTRPSLLQVREGDVAVAVLPDDVFAHARPEQP